MQKLQKSTTKPVGTKHFAGAVMLSLMLSLAPTGVAANEGGDGGVGYSDDDPSIQIYGDPRVLERFRVLIKIAPDFYIGLLLNYIRTGKLISGFFSGVG